MKATNYYVISIEDTKKYGLIDAAIIGRVRWWCEYNQKNKVKDRFHKGEWWSGFMSAREFSEQTGIKQRTIESHLTDLVENGVLIKDRFNKKGFYKTGWYRVNPSTQIAYSIYADSVDDVRSESISIYANSVDPYTPLEETIPVNLSVNNSVKQSVNNSVNLSVNPDVELTNFEKENLLLSLGNYKVDQKVLMYVRMLIEDGPSVLTVANKKLILENKKHFNRGTLIQKVINQLD
jgi:DNA-binding transcriptional ArsR family regulator